MKFSVIIPAYQCENSISDTVDSILHSGLTNFEIIIIDDGSTDNTASICKEISQKYNNVDYYYQPNQGVSSARNNGISYAKGEYLWLVDADDSVDLGSLKEVVDTIKSTAPDIVIFGMSFDYYYRGNLYRRDRFNCSQEGLFQRNEFDRIFGELYQVNYLTPSWNKIVKKSILIDHQLGYRTDYFLMEDFLFSLDILQFCNTVYLIKKDIYRYRQAEDEGNVYRRLDRITDLSRFIIPFKERLKDYPDVLSQVYYMLLQQKLWKATIKKIRDIAGKHTICDIQPVLEKDKEIDLLLRHKKYKKIYLSNRKKQFRHEIAVIVKQSTLYKTLKAPVTY